MKNYHIVGNFYYNKMNGKYLLNRYNDDNDFPFRIFITRKSMLQYLKQEGIIKNIQFPKGRVK